MWGFWKFFICEEKRNIERVLETSWQGCLKKKWLVSQQVRRELSPRINVFPPRILSTPWWKELREGEKLWLFVLWFVDFSITSSSHICVCLHRQMKYRFHTSTYYFFFIYIIFEKMNGFRIPRGIPNKGSKMPKFEHTAEKFVLNHKNSPAGEFEKKAEKATDINSDEEKCLLRFGSKKVSTILHLNWVNVNLRTNRTHFACIFTSILFRISWLKGKQHREKFAIRKNLARLSLLVCVSLKSSRTKIKTLNLWENAMWNAHNNAHEIASRSWNPIFVIMGFVQMKINRWKLFCYLRTNREICIRKNCHHCNFKNFGKSLLQAPPARIFMWSR